MPKRTIVLDYHACEPAKCPGGICQAVLLCKKRVLTQEAPYEMPDSIPSMCLSCALCMQACAQDAIRVM